MGEFIAAILSFPTVIPTVMLGFVLAYWLFVIFGAADVDMLDGGAHGAHALEGAGHGALDAGVDGVADGVAEGAAESALEGAAHAHDAGDVHHGGLFQTFAFFGIKKAPVTVVFSLLTLFSWLFVGVSMQYLGGLFTSPILQTLLGFGVLLGGFVAAIPVTSIVLRPMGPLFEIHGATTRDAMVGRICTLMTSSVDGGFGQATYEARDESMLFQVRCDRSNQLKKGERALIIDFDDKREAFLIEPLDPNDPI